MKRKMISLLLVISMIVSLCVGMINTASAANAVSISNVKETKISVELVTDSSTGGGKVPIQWGYASFNSGNWLDFTVDFPKTGNYKICTYAYSVTSSNVPMSIGLGEKVLGQGYVGIEDKNYSVAYDLGTYNFEEGIKTLRLTNNGGVAHVAFLSVAPVATKTSS